MTSDPWFPLLALIECRETSSVARALAADLAVELPCDDAQPPSNEPPSAELREVILKLREILRSEYPHDSAPSRFWLLLDTQSTDEDAGMRVDRVLEELRLKFQSLRPNDVPGDESVENPDFEKFLRERMSAIGFEDLGSSPLLPDLQREALRGLGMGLGSQLAQTLGRMAGWYGDPKLAKLPASAPEPEGRGRLLRLELGAALRADEARYSKIRQDFSKIRRRMIARLGWEVSATGLIVNKDLAPEQWRMMLRGQSIGEGVMGDDFADELEALLMTKIAALFTYADFELLVRPPDIKSVVRELNSMGLEKAALWTILRRLIGDGVTLVEPLTLFENLLEASITSHDHTYLVEALRNQHRA